MPKELALKLLKDQNFDCLAVGVIDFKKSKIKTLEIEKLKVSKKPHLFFDLASLTKALTLSAVKFANPALFESDFDLLLNHQAGLSDWARLSKKHWRDDLKSLPIKKSETKYSDLGALRLMLEIEKKSGKSLKELSSFYWNKDLLFWKDLKSGYSPATGHRAGEPIMGVVHDDNAFNIDDFCSHAGLFATINGLCLGLLDLNDATSFVSKMKELLKNKNSRFIEGWDTPEKDSLAGNDSQYIFGHLGFTGTSIWIDSEKEIGQIILTNATKNYWYDREGLNNLRRTLGAYLWNLKV